MAINILGQMGNLGAALRSLLRIMARPCSCSWHDEALCLFYRGVGEGGTVVLLSQSGLAASFGTFGGLLLLVGLFTPPVAFILAGEMAVAYFQFHAPAGFWPLVNKGELAALYCFLWLYFSAAGPGPWSLDALLGRRPRNS